MKNFLIITIVSLFMLDASAQTIYYVDAVNGNDLNNGTSLLTSWRTIQKACNAATPNSIVLIKAGTYSENIVVNVSGTAGNPITFRNYMNDLVLIDGGSATGTTMLDITDKSYLNFQNLTIQNRTINNAKGILVQTTGTNTSTALSFKNIILKNINWTGSTATIPTASDNAQPFIAYGRDGGITNVLIDSCQAFNNILGYSEAMTLDGNVNGFTIKNCQVHDNTNIGIDIIGNYGVSTNPATDKARNASVINNTCYRNVSQVATSAGIYVDGGKNVIVEKNKCYENGWGIEVGCEQNGTADSIEVKNNLIFNNKQGGLAVGGYTTMTTGQVLNCVIRNNTLFQDNSINDGTGELFLMKATNCIFKNNAFYTNNQNTFMNVVNILPQANNVFNYNCWFTPSNSPNNITVNWRTTVYTTFATYQAGTSQETNSIYSNAGFTNPILPAPDLHISASSPCINAGDPATLISVGETDYDGNMRIMAGIIDIGAYEYNSASGINNTTANSVQGFAYPNPFISATTIFLSAELKNAEMKIYDILGNEIKKVKNITGRQISLDRNNLANGIYLYKITQDGNIIAEGKLIAE